MSTHNLQTVWNSNLVKYPASITLVNKCVPMARRKFSMRTSVFLISLEKTSLPTMGQKGTLGPSSCAIAKAIAVFPVPGAPAKSNARPDIFFDLIRSTTTPQAYFYESWRRK